jgi:hypothetical protein
MNLNQFANWIKVVAGRVPGEANRVKRLTALAVDQTVVTSTPVDTGLARSCWLVTLGKPTDAVLKEAYAPTSHGGISETANANAAMEQGKGVIAAAKPGEVLFIANNVKYVVPLNEGHSAQAPAMFVEAAVAAGQAAVQGAKVSLSP